MRVFRTGIWIGLCCFSLVLWFALAPTGDAKAQNSCSQAGCHQKWFDNSVSNSDATSHNGTIDYLPLNLVDTVKSKFSPFYWIPKAHDGSIHGVSNVQCISCHVSMNSAHAKNMVSSDTCLGCHNALNPEVSGYPQTRHANPNGNPTKLFDQTGKGGAQAYASAGQLMPALPLYKKDKTTIVTQKNRLEDCSVCHNYAMVYSQYKSNLGTSKLDPQVGCAACHDAHTPAPSDEVTVDNTVLATLSGTTVVAVTPTTGRSVLYRDLKPFKLSEAAMGAVGQAQDVKNGTWDRGTLYTRPNLPLIEGTGAIDATDPTLLTYTTGGFTLAVEPEDTVFITGTAEATVPLPADASVPGNVTVTANLTRAGFNVEQVIDGQNLKLSPGVVATATVTYTRATPPPNTATLSVPVTFVGQNVTFEVVNMNTNPETLCGSCHTTGTYKNSAWGKFGSTFIDVSQTHNNDILPQYKSAGHADILAPPWEEFSARPYGGSHTTVYPFDMSITGATTTRNGGNTDFVLTSTVPATNAYLSVVGNTTLAPLVNNYACFQCHNGIGAIDYINNVQGTSDAHVLWGDATVTCLTCHDTHNLGAGANIRTPVYLSLNSRFTQSSPVGKIDKFMDGTDIPTGTGTGIVCLFCHQGRESGLTLYARIVGQGIDPYANPTATIPGNISFMNPHYLESGAILWSKNPWEYVTQEYSTGIPAHQNLNCAGCHMAEATADNSEGGHTWKPKVETCQGCHGSSVTVFADIPAIGDYDGNGTVGTAFEEIGTINPDTGLYGQLKAALQGVGIYYDPDTYPYFFSDAGHTTAFTAWTTNTLSASFDLSFLYKSGNCVPYHNAWYGAQILQDSLAALGVDTSAYFRPDIFNRPATNYSESPYITQLP